MLPPATRVSIVRVTRTFSARGGIQLPSEVKIAGNIKYADFERFDGFDEAGESLDLEELSR